LIEEPLIPTPPIEPPVIATELSIADNNITYIVLNEASGHASIRG
jgi:hypothetical protein